MYLSEAGTQVKSPLKLRALDFGFVHFSAHNIFKLLVGTRNVGCIISHFMQEVFQDRCFIICMPKNKYEKTTKNRVRFILLTDCTVDLTGPRARGKVGAIVGVISSWRTSRGYEAENFCYCLKSFATSRKRGLWLIVTKPFYAVPEVPYHPGPSNSR